jgi:hypothetical protein
MRSVISDFDPQHKTTTIMFSEMTPISRLPNELVEAIFDLHVTWMYKERYCSAVLFLAYTHVCRWWREIALSSPRLWRYIDVCRPTLALTLLPRARSSVPLSVVSSSSEMLRYYLRLHPYATRISEVDIDLWHLDIRQLFRIGDSYPKLSSLRVISRRHGGVDDDVELYCDLPSLRRLSLDGVSVRWSSLVGLTHLSVSDLCIAHAPSISQIHIVLQNSPLLESLALAFLVHTHSMEFHIQRRVIELPRLWDIHLCLCPDFTSSLLGGMLISSSARLRIGPFSDFDGFLSIFPTVDGSYYPHLRITKHSTLSIRLREIILRQSSTSPFGNVDLKPDLHIDLPRPTPAYSWILSDMPRLFDLFALTLLELDIIWAVDVQNIARALYTLLTATPNLRTLRASQHGVECLSMVLGRPGPDRLEFDVLCPSLTRLSFGAPDQMWWDFPLLWLKPLVTCLEERMVCTDSRLQTIEFIGQGRIEKQSLRVIAPFVLEIVDSVSAGRLEPLIYYNLNSP